MAKERAVWGIDIGQSALKALRCFRDDEGNIVADSYDFVEYAKSLSMPDADVEELVRDAMDDFLSRNELRGDRVAITIAGQAGLCRFFKPPPVDSKTLPDIVKYEVRQQIPFPIEDIVWDWQGLGGREMEGVLVDSEVGLFAIKRDAVFTALQPFLNRDIEVDLVQLSPLAIHNVVCEELLEAPAEVDEDEDEDPVDREYIMALSFGTDATDLLITNGVKLWLRNIPIGGNHFTKQLSRELKLTQAKAEYLKRNAHQSENPKAIFQAMRPVFNDLVMEIQRSMSFYKGMEKDAQIEKLVLMGNAARLPGLRQYLNRQIGLSISKVAGFGKLKGEIVDEKIFHENLLSFAPCYGLCLQELNQAHLKTNLLPRELILRRVIENKKPWALASVSLAMLGMMFGLFFVSQKLWAVSPEYVSENISWETAFKGVSPLTKRSRDFVGEDNNCLKQLKDLNVIAKRIAGTTDIRETRANAWPELLSALGQILPKDPRMGNSDRINPNEIPFADRREIYIVGMDSKPTSDISISWLKRSEQISILKLYNEQLHGVTDDVDVVATAQPADDGKKKKTNKKKRNSSRNKKKADKKKKVVDKMDHDLSKKAGFVVELTGYHDFNSREKRDLALHGRAFVKTHFVDRFLNDEIQLPGENGEMEMFRFVDLGVFYPTIIHETEVHSVAIARINDLEKIDSVDAEDVASPSAEAMPKVAGDEKVERYDFVLQFAFIPASRVERTNAKAQRLQAETAVVDAKDVKPE